MMRSGGGAKDSLVYTSLVGKVILVAAYICLNLSLNLLNKWTLSLYGFRFPILLSIAHMAFSFVALAPFMLCKGRRENHMPTLHRQWTGLLSIGLFFAINVGFNNVSLLSIPLSLNQVIRSSIPVAAAFGAVFIERKPPSRQEFLSLFILVTGVGIAVWEGSAQHVGKHGVALCIMGTISNGLMMSAIGKLLSEKLDVARMTFYTAPVTCIALVPFFLALEGDAYAKYSRSHDHQVYFGILLLGCVNALSYNLVHTMVIKATSSVTTTVLGEMKIIAILVMSAMLLGEKDIWTLKMLIGCTTAIMGFCMYSHSRLAASSVQLPPVIKGVPELTPLLEATKGSLSGSMGSLGPSPNKSHPKPSPKA